MAGKAWDPRRGFYEKLRRTESGCLEWTGCILPSGYGQVSRRALSPAPLLTHRLAYYLAYGEWPEVVMHTCDNRPCCEPTHLQAGTIALNNTDMHRKGRGSKPPVKKWCSEHPDTPENRKPNGHGKWTCRECNRARQRRAYATR